MRATLLCLSLCLMQYSYPSAKESPSLETKVAQLLMISIDIAELAKATEAAKAGIGGVQLQWGSYSLEDTRRLTNLLQAYAAQSPERTPLLIATDYEGGSVYAPITLGLAELPTNMMLGAANSENDTASLFYLAGRELRRAGINMAFGPVMDVNTNPQNPIIGTRAIGGNPELVSRIGAAVMNGFKAGGILTVAKHFPGHGAARLDSHKTLPTIDLPPNELQATHLPPFIKAIDLQVPMIMTAHILYRTLDSGNAATLSKTVIMGLLKGKLGFKGLVITDSMDMRAITSKFHIHKAAALAVKAGADIVLIGKGDFTKAKDEIVAQVRAGTITETRINDAYYRVLEAKRRAGLFEKEPPPSPFDKAYINIAATISRKAVTLVKDMPGLLPVTDKRKRIAVILYAPARFNENALAFYKTLAASGYSVRQAVFDINPDKAAIEKAMGMASEADILILGSFQWAEAQNINQKKAIRTLLATRKPAILISLMSPYDMNNYPEAGTIIAIFGITPPSMTAVAEHIAGEIPAGGTLPVSLGAR